jgi:protein-S-isoprenylcysteine O-methyltransferase Ste14
MSRVAIVFLMIVTPALAICLALLGLETLRTNLLGWFLFLTGILYATGIVIVAYIRRISFWESQRNSDFAQEEFGDRSFWLITLGMMAVFYLSPLEYIYIAASLPRTVWMEVFGMVLVVLGSALFVWARRTLGVNYSGHVSVKQGQELMQTGPYQIVRHPAYGGYLLMAFGIAIGYSSIAGLIAILGFLLPSLFYRMNVEEKYLFAYFGEAYHRYAGRTKRLIPGIW